MGAVKYLNDPLKARVSVLPYPDRTVNTRASNESSRRFHSHGEDPHYLKHYANQASKMKLDHQCYNLAAFAIQPDVHP